MSNRRFAPTLALWFSLFSQTVHAFIGPPALSPESPIAGEIVSVNIPVGVCDAVIEEPGFPQITVVGSTVRVLVATVFSPDDVFCIYPIRTSSYAIGAFAAGTYDVQVDRQYPWENPDIMVETIGVLPLVVRGAAAPVSAPTLGPTALLIAGLLLLSAALRHCRMPDQPRG